MEQDLSHFQNKLVTTEDLFFTWLLRVIVAAILVGSAQIDDAPPLELAASIIALYILIRLLMNFKTFISTAPFSPQIFKVLFALGCLFLLSMSFATILIFTNRIVSMAAG